MYDPKQTDLFISHLSDASHELLFIFLLPMNHYSSSSSPLSPITVPSRPPSSSPRSPASTASSSHGAPARPGLAVVPAAWPAYLPGAPLLRPVVLENWIG